MENEDRLNNFNVSMNSQIPVPSTSSTNLSVDVREGINKVAALTIHERPVGPLQCLEFTTNCYHDFTGKIRSKRSQTRFKLSLSSIDEVVYQDIGTLVLKSNQERHLCRAVLSNEIGFVTTLLDLGVPVNCFDQHKRTPLHLAVSKGYCEMVQLLLNKGADPNIKDGLGNSCLHLAACTNNVDMALILIKGGASVNTVDIRGRSPVQLAQSKLRILQQSQNEFVKSKVTQIIDMLLLYLEKGSKKTEKNEEAELLANFQTRLQITDTPEQISNEIDNLSKILDQMGTLSLS